MCRLFGLNASPSRIHAKFWLLDEPDSVVVQSHKNPDGTGLGYFDAAKNPVIDKEPLAAFGDIRFARAAKHVASTVFVSHIRHATTGEKTVENCHPFSLDGRIFAHNGVLGGLRELEKHLGDDLSLVRGQTDSERYFALINKEIRAHQGDVRAGLASAVRWVVANLPLVSINCLLATYDELWAFRYPETDGLFVLERESGGRSGRHALALKSSRLHVHSEHLAHRRCVVVASEPLDDRADWRALRSGELLRIDADQQVSSSLLIDAKPKPMAAASYL